MTITREWLEKHYACGEGMEWFISTFPDGMEINPENIKKFDDHEDYLGWLLAQEIKVTRELLKNGANIHAYGDYAIQLATKDGHLEVCKLLLKHRANVHADHNWALCKAAYYGFTKICKLLLKYGANVHANNNHPYRAAIENNHLETAALLKEWMDKI